MTRFGKVAMAVVVAGAALACAERVQAQSWGFMHLPSTTPQYLGYGYGAGHHAPIVKTPAQRPPRMQRWMRVPACYGSLAPAAYAPMGCYGGSCAGGQAYSSDEATPIPLPPVEEPAAAAWPTAVQGPHYGGP